MHPVSFRSADGRVGPIAARDKAVHLHAEQSRHPALGPHWSPEQSNSGQSQEPGTGEAAAPDTSSSSPSRSGVRSKRSAASTAQVVNKNILGKSGMHTRCNQDSIRPCGTARASTISYCGTLTRHPLMYVHECTLPPGNTSHFRMGRQLSATLHYTKMRSIVYQPVDVRLYVHTLHRSL
ncbi:hypothetical protein VTI28DRAFT_1112 [Corynascus sepedonium]